MFAGGGVLGGANAVAMSDDDGDGVWEATVEMEEGTSGNYAFFNSPTSERLEYKRKFRGSRMC